MPHIASGFESRQGRDMENSVKISLMAPFYTAICVCALLATKSLVHSLDKVGTRAAQE